MFRRRRIFRPIVPLSIPVTAVNRQTPHPEVVHAHDLMAQGQYLEAAALFSRIAEAVRVRNGPRAPIFSIQAGRAFILAGQVDQGMASLQRGLEGLAVAARWSDLEGVGLAVVDQLNEKGYPVQAKIISDWLAVNLEGKSVAAAVTPPAKQPVLPTRCPSCGAGVNSKEVSWLDDLTAECLYCGGSIRAES
jgi:hypothetical protein